MGLQSLHLDEFLIILYPCMLEVCSASEQSFSLQTLMESSLELAQHDDALILQYQCCVYRSG